MTELLFRDDAYLRDCTARVVAHVGTAGGEEGAVLDRTVFYPTGGGQPGDGGTLEWEGRETVVSTAVKGEDGAVVHVRSFGEPLPPVGAEVTARLAWDVRHRHMRCHTALHLLSVVLPFPVTGGSIGADRGRLDFDMAEPPGDREALEAELLRLVAEDHPVTSEWITDAELEANPGLVKTMAVKPPTGTGRVRLVRIGTPDRAVDLQPCGGTHVARTGEIGAVSLGKIEKKGRQNRRVTLLIGP